MPACWTTTNGKVRCLRLVSISLQRGADEDTVSRHAEIDQLMADVARANGRTADMERRNVRIFLASIPAD
jgi:hypothetical protein